ncbi:MAG: hypothetical protein KDD64_02600 [Bdellovibrionales bacterium]|nr:hypothetical protein [Bdellovibrionales bacterium]
MESTATESIKDEILAVLSHPEAEDGLYLRNFLFLHFEDERPEVHASSKQLMRALNELIRDGDIRIASFDDQVVFRLKSPLVEPMATAEGLL